MNNSMPYERYNQEIESAGSDDAIWDLCLLLTMYRVEQCYNVLGLRGCLALATSFICIAVWCVLEHKFFCTTFSPTCKQYHSLEKWAQLVDIIVALSMLVWRGLFSDFGGYPVGYACMALSKIVNHCAMVHNCGLDWLDLDMNGILVLIPALANNKSLRWGENDISTNGIQALSAELQSDFLRMKGFESYSKN